jgi:hypothetical protein
MRMRASRAEWRLLGTLAVEALLVLSSFAAGRELLFSHPLAIGPTTPSLRLLGTDTITVVAGMIAFQPESPDNPFTTGTGTFDTSHPASPVLDAPPHAARYFSGHLAFLQDYVSTVSRGRVAVRVLLLPTIATMPKGMGEYAPSPDDPLSTELAHVVDTAWRALDIANPGVTYPAGDPSRTFFVLFHAGVGRDIDLSSAYGYNPQPQDLPSLYFSLTALQRTLGAGYEGVPIANGTVTVTNSAVIPETESRLVNGQQIVLGINGVLVASLGSFLGLPDLFNTVSGYTAVGRFGLEDIASIFAFGGFFPPMPGAWERTALGWETPSVVHAGDDQKLTLTALQRATGSEATCYRVPLSDREYFLLENRQRNPDQSGIYVYQQVDTGTVIFHGSSDNTGFRDGDLSSLRGVITKCSTYDWSVAGSGIVIWHIDENIIDAYRADNRVNGSGHVRGVRVMEADGGQQIGVPVQTVFGTYISEGYDGDTWHRGNIENFPGYTNSFSDTSLPSARSNNGSPSRLAIREFDSIGGRMSFHVVSTAMPRLAAGFPVRIGGDPGTNPVVIADIDGDNAEEILISTSRGIYARRRDGSNILKSGDTLGLFVPDAGIVRCPSVDSLSRLIVAVSMAHDPGAGADLRAWQATDTNRDGYADLVWSRTLFLGAPRSVTVPMVTADGFLCGVDTALVLIDRSGGEVLRMGVRLPSGPGHIVALAATETPGRVVVALQEEVVALVDVNTRSAVWITNVETRGLSSLAVARFGDDGRMMRIGACDTTGALVELLLDGSQVGVNHLRSSRGAVQINHSGAMAAFMPLSGAAVVVARGTDDLFAFTSTLALSADFPVHLEHGTEAAPIVGRTDATMTGSASRDIVLTVAGTMLYAHDADRSTTARISVQDDYPIALGSTVRSTPAVGTHLLALATPTGSLLVYDVPFTADAWPQYLHDAGHTSYSARQGAPSQTQVALLPREKVFNWPNPVREKNTRIRFYVSRRATVRIRITNLVNELVDALPDMKATGGVDTEIPYNTGEMQSGVYIVRVEAEGEDGTTEVAFTKMAVVN